MGGARHGVRSVPGVLGVTRRRALRGPGAPAGGRGRTETPPAKLSMCATCHDYGTLPSRGAHGGAMGTSRPTAMPHAHYARNIRTRGARALSGRRDGRPLGVPTLPARALPQSRAKNEHKDHSDEGIGTQRR